MVHYLAPTYLSYTNTSVHASTNALSRHVYLSETGEWPTYLPLFTSSCRLLVWRSTRDILTRPPGVGQRMTTGPSFFPEFGCNFNNSHRPSAPSYQDQQVVGRWVSFPHHTLVAWGKEQGLDQLVLGSGGANIAAALCSQFQLQEEGLLWCVTQYAQLVKGVELERDLKALISLDNRARLGQLPVFIMGLGQRLRYNRELMWAYNVFRNTEVRTC